MSKSNFFDVSMTRREQLFGWLYLTFQATLLPRLLSAVLLILFPGSGATALNLFLFAVNFAVCAGVFRRFLLRSLSGLRGRIGPLLLKCALVLVICRIAGIAINSCLCFCCPQYFTVTAFGPMLQNINDQAISQMVREQYALVAISTVFLVPVAEELLHRGVVFGSIYPKSPALAWTVSTLLFAAVHVLGYLGIPDKFYLLICFLQYIPPALGLCWLYRSTGSVFAPIFMHALFNAIGILSVR